MEFATILKSFREQQRVQHIPTSILQQKYDVFPIKKLSIVFAGTFIFCYLFRFVFTPVDEQKPLPSTEFSSGNSFLIFDRSLGIF